MSGGFKEADKIVWCYGGGAVVAHGMKINRMHVQQCFIQHHVYIALSIIHHGKGIDRAGGNAKRGN